MDKKMHDDTYYLQQFNREKKCRLQIVGEVGRGSSGIVYEVRPMKYALQNWFSARKYPEEPMVMKIMKTDTLWTDEHSSEWEPIPLQAHGERAYWNRHYRNEIKLMETLADCVYTMPLLDSLIIEENNQSCSYVFLLLMPKLVPLDKYIGSISAQQWKEKDLVQVARDISHALAGCYDHQILHRDLKPGNIFVQELPGGGKRYILGDFGCCRWFRMDTKSTVTRVGTPEFIDDVLKRGEIYPDEYVSDVCSLGKVLFHLAANGKPLKVDMNGVVDASPLEHLTEGFRSFILKAIMLDKTKRFQHAYDMLAALKDVNQNSATAIQIDRDYHLAKMALEKGDCEAALQYSQAGRRSNKKDCAVLELYCRIRQYMQSPVGGAALGRLSAWAVDLYYEDSHPAVGCMVAMLSMEENKQEDFLDYMQMSADSGFVPAKYFYGRALYCGYVSGIRNRPKGLMYVFAAAEAGYWDALMFVRELEKQDPSMTIPQQVRCVMNQLIADELGSAAAHSIDMRRNRESIVKFL